MPAAADWLDRPLFVLDVGRRGFAPLTWRDDVGLVGLAFADVDLAQRHAERFRSVRRAPGAAHAGTGRRPTPTVLTLAPADLRAREEWLQAVLHAGAARVAFDLPLAGPPASDAFELTGALLAEVLSHKRGLACS